MRYPKSRLITGTPKNVTIVREGDKWFARIQTELEIPDKVPKNQSMVGIDRGTKVLRLFPMAP